MALENSMLVIDGKQVGGDTEDLTAYQTKVDNNLQTTSKETTGAINELNSNLTSKQDATDNNLTTTNKTIVGGINELKSGLTNVQHSFTKRTFVLSAQYAESYYLFEQNIALDGWYPLSVASFRGSTVSVNISNVTVGSSENKLYCDVYNITGNTIPSDYKVTVDVLYTKSIMI